MPSDEIVSPGKCRKCGYPVFRGQRYCTECGAPIGFWQRRLSPVHRSLDDRPRESIGAPVTIYVAIVDETVDESVDVWRPVLAEPLGGDEYRIIPQPYPRDLETWEFVPGDIVECEMRPFAEGPALTALRRSGYV